MINTHHCRKTAGAVTLVPIVTYTYFAYKLTIGKWQRKKLKVFSSRDTVRQDEMRKSNEMHLFLEIFHYKRNHCASIISLKVLIRDWRCMTIEGSKRGKREGEGWRQSRPSPALLSSLPLFLTTRDTVTRSTVRANACWKQ